MASPDLHTFSTAEKILYLQDLWDEISPEVEDLALTPAQRVLLEARLEDERLHPEDESPWEVVRERLRASR